MRIFVLFICILSVSCSDIVEQKQRCAECEVFFQEHKKIKSNFSFNPKNKNNKRFHIVSRKNITPILSHKFCFLEKSEEFILNFFKHGYYQVTKDKIEIRHTVKNSDEFNILPFYFKEINGKRVNVGNQVDSFLLEQCLMKKNRK